jgi:hypothetical protein
LGNRNFVPKHSKAFHGVILPDQKFFKHTILETLKIKTALLPRKALINNGEGLFLFQKQPTTSKEVMIHMTV